MSYNIEEADPNVVAIMNLFVTINKLTKFYDINQAIDVLDIYFKTGDIGYITKSNDVRDFVANIKLRETMLPLIGDNYNHLSDYISELCSSEKRKL